jgi:hypothetical protein
VTHLKIVIQNTETGALYKGDGRWTDSWGAARQYSSVIQAYETIIRERLEKVCIRMGLGQPGLDVCLPVR